LFRLLLFFPVLLLAQEIFLLPDEGRYFLDTLNAKIKKAEHQLYLFTPFLDEYSLIRTLKQRAKKELQITIITSEPLQKQNKAAHLALFENIQIFTLSPLDYGSENPQALSGSFGCIDNKELFLLSEDLDGKKIRADYAFALFQKKACETIFHTLLQRTKAY
jgi:hypothetical protein